MTSGALVDWLENNRSHLASGIACRVLLRVLPVILAQKASLNSPNFSIRVWQTAILGWAYQVLSSDKIYINFKVLPILIREIRSDDNENIFDTFTEAAVATLGRKVVRIEKLSSASIGASLAVAKANIGLGSPAAYDQFWDTLHDDCIWLDRQKDKDIALKRLARRPLWLALPPSRGFLQSWDKVIESGLEKDANFQFWIDWYERRNRGESAAFDIPGDKSGKENKWLLRQIANAGGEEFWDRGAEYVNRQLAEWLEEARERAAKNLKPSEIAKAEKPDFQIPPEPGRRLYGFNQDGLLDRLPPSQQDQLRDSPNQRRAYQHIRDDLKDLLSEGQKLGRRLQELLERALEDFPDDFGNAEADIVWRHIGKLRRAYRKHLAAPRPPELDDHRLDPQIAIDLGGLLDGMNNFVPGDQGLLRRQEDAVDPQLRGDRKEEAKAAEPLAQATIASESVVTRAVKQDIAQGNADLDAALPNAESGDPSADAEVDSINRERRNIFGGLLTGAKDTLKDARSGAAKEAGKQSLDFVTKNSQTIIDYVRKAFSQETAEAIIKWIGSLF